MSAALKRLMSKINKVDCENERKPHQNFRSLYHPKLNKHMANLHSDWSLIMTGDFDDEDSVTKEVGINKTIVFIHDPDKMNWGV